MKNTMLTAKDFETALPEFTLISDEGLREKCLNTMLAAAHAGGWTRENLGLAPVSLTKVKKRDLNKQFDHLRAVTKIAAGMCDILTEQYGGNAIDRDIVIAGALLHDVGKFTEFVPCDGEVRYAENAKLMRHPLSGAILAAREGLPDEIVHIIAVHSFEGKDSHETLESIIVKTADDVAFKYITFCNS